MLILEHGGVDTIGNKGTTSHSLNYNDFVTPGNDGLVRVNDIFENIFSIAKYVFDLVNHVDHVTQAIENNGYPSSREVQNTEKVYIQIKIG